MMSNFIFVVALIVHLILAAVCVWKVWRGENVIDRLLSADVIGTLTLAIFVLLSLLNASSFYIDAALGLAALAAIGTVSLARYIANKRVS